MPSVKEQIEIRNNVTATGLGDRTIIWAHGFGCDQTIWSRQVDFFHKDFRCLLFDQIGSTEKNAHLFSSPKYRTLDGFVEDLEEVSLYFSKPQSILVAHSVGAMIGLLASIKRPGLFSKILTIGASPRYLTDADFPGVYGQEEINVIYQRMKESYQAWAETFSAAMMKHTSRPELAAMFMKGLKQLRPDIAQAMLCLILQSDFRAELEQVSVPVVIIQPTNDPVVPVSIGKYMSQKIRKSTLVQINVEGHLPHVAAPELINEVVRNHLNSN